MSGGHLPAWATALGPDLEPALVTGILTAAVSGRAGPEALRRVLAHRLERGDSTDVAAVVAELAAPPPDARPTDATAMERAARALLDAGARVLAAGRPGYPANLGQTWPELGAPAWLFAIGPLPPIPQVAIVGTRRPSLDGLRTARGLAAYLAERGIGVVSGLARGIDQAAHRGALDRDGATIGVLGTGFGVDYPRGAGPLRDEVAASAGLVSEYVPGTPAHPHHFLQRNRIVSGLATVVVVVEGRGRSGALQTARLAAAQGREVFAVPGSLNTPTSRGPLDLIRDGARVLTGFDDVLDALGLSEDGALLPQRAGTAPGPGASGPGGADDRLPGLPPEARTLLDLLSAAPASPGALAARAGLSVPATLAALGVLQRRGLAASGPRGFSAGGPPPHPTR